jgi:hypothetical protein
VDGRERFNQIMRYGVADRVPLFEEGIREEVLEVWHKQGLLSHADLCDLFCFDRYERIEPELGPRPEPAAWPSSISELDPFRRLLNPDDSSRLPQDWSNSIQLWGTRSYPLMLSVCNGLFLSLGVDGWQTFSEVAYRLACEPQVAEGTMRIQGEFAARLAENVLNEVEIDAAGFLEPICDNHGPLVSPRMYEEYALKSYQPILEVLNRKGVETIIFMTWANARLILPSVVKYGFNCLWAYEANTPAMGYCELRREFGRDLRLIGGIDLDKVREGDEAIRREILEKVPPLLADGGYIPLADGRVREDIPFSNYVYYRRLLEETVMPRRNRDR